MENYFFNEYLEKGEVIKYVLHVHPIIYHIEFSKIKLTYIVLPAVLWFFFPVLKWVCIALIVWGLLKILSLAWDWYYDCWLVTNKGVISIQSEGFWHINATRIEHNAISGITYDINGAVKMMLDYGNITLERVGNGKKITLKDALKPLDGELQILKWQKAYMQEQSQQNQSDFRDMLQQMTLAYAKAQN